MFERPRGGERAVLVHLSLDKPESSQDFTEFQELAASAGAECVALITGRRRAPDPRLFVGGGKAEEIRDAARSGGAELVIFDHALSPSQERNLETLLQCRVLGRTGLILDIFAQRARSFEGKLQVELAQLRHLSTRLVRGWTHLERQRGGIGLRGPGETQLETDRRLLADRIRQIRLRLDRVERQREQGRRARRKADLPTVSLVGYTNAGKSTLFNALTQAGVYVADQLFATLDPTLRRLNLPGAEPVVLADTVGFVSRLPHELVAAFRATLRETCEASLLLHVIDVGHPDRDDIIAQVDAVLTEIGAAEVPRLQVFNKIDLMGESPRLERDAEGQPRAVWLSAASGTGTDLLVAALAERLRGETVHGWLCLPPAAARLRARLFNLDAVVDERIGPEGEWLIEVRTSRGNMDLLRRRDGLQAEWVRSGLAIPAV
ncbi:MAG: GTPase HflX [Candidatus Competibacteraceae bacterium]|nr:MAG: GTPase HflX [Candidatus Competibacteraceae bacterium]